MLHNFLVFYDENCMQQTVCELDSGRTSWVSKNLKTVHVEVQNKEDVEETFKSIVGFTHRIIQIQECNYERSSTL